MTTFSLVQSTYANSTTNLTLGSPVTAGNLLVCLVSERSGRGSTSHTLTDSAGGTWTRIANRDVLLGDSNARHSAALWARKIAAGESDTTPTVSRNDTGFTYGMTLVEIAPDAAYAFDVAEVGVGDSGSGLWTGNPITTGPTASLTGPDLFEFAIAANKSGGLLSTAITFSPHTDANTFHTSFNGFERNSGHAMRAAGQAGGIKTTTATITGGSDHRGIVFLAVFRNTAAPSPLTLTAVAPQSSVVPRLALVAVAVLTPTAVAPQAAQVPSLTLAAGTSLNPVGVVPSASVVPRLDVSAGTTIEPLAAAPQPTVVPRADVAAGTTVDPVAAAPQPSVVPQAEVVAEAAVSLVAVQPSAAIVPQGEVEAGTTLSLVAVAPEPAEVPRAEVVTEGSVSLTAVLPAASVAPRLTVVAGTDVDPAGVQSGAAVVPEADIAGGATLDLTGVVSGAAVAPQLEVVEDASLALTGVEAGAAVVPTITVIVQTAVAPAGVVAGAAVVPLGVIGEAPSRWAVTIPARDPFTVTISARPVATVTIPARGAYTIEVQGMTIATLTIEDYSHGEPFSLRATVTDESGLKTTGTLVLRFALGATATEIARLDGVHEGAGGWLFDGNPALPEGRVIHAQIWDEAPRKRAEGSFHVGGSIDAAA